MLCFKTFNNILRFVQIGFCADLAAFLLISRLMQNQVMFYKNYLFYKLTGAAFAKEEKSPPPQ